MPPEGCWIKYQLDLRNIKLDAVARRANRSLSLVSSVIRGIRNSKTGPFAKLANQNQVDAYISAIGGVVRYIAGAYFDASRVVPTASENRPSNRQFIIWQKTAL
jgi:hypothetical protein